MENSKELVYLFSLLFYRDRFFGVVNKRPLDMVFSSFFVKWAFF